MATTETAQLGRFVKIRYAIKFEDGTQVDKDRTKRPLSFKMGSGRIFRKLEEGIVGMKLNEVREITLAPEYAYGPYKKELVLKVDRKVFPDDLSLSLGKTIQYQDRTGSRANFIVNAFDDKSVTIDGNHPLAGLNLKYEVELLELN